MIGPGEEMVEPDARRVVATVQDVHPVRDRSHGDGPSYAVGPVPLLRVDLDVAIPSTLDGARPDLAGSEVRYVGWGLC